MQAVDRKDCPNGRNMLLGSMAEEGERAFSEFYEARKGALLRFLTARLKCREEAEDVLQETFLQFRNTREKMEIANPDALLIKIAANLSIDRIRQNNSRMARERAWSDIYLRDGAAGDLGTTRATQHRSLEARGEIDRVIRVLKGLSYPVRTAFILHRFKGLSHQEVSEEMGLAKSTIEKHIIKTMRVLAKELK